MWINDKLNENETKILADIATVTNINGNKISASGDIQYVNIPCMSYFGLNSMPQVNDNAVIIKTSKGYLCIGNITDYSFLENDIVLKSKNNGKIEFKPNGKISVNGTLF